MGTLLKAKGQRAKKDHCDDSAEFIKMFLFECPVRTGFSFNELRAIAKLKANNWMIKKGEPYVRQFCINSDGQTYTFKTLPKILRICLKHNLYEQ